MQHEFKVVFDLYNETVNDKGEPEYELLKKDVKKRWFCKNIHEITDIKEVVTNTGKIIKNKCDIYVRSENKWITVEGTYDNMKQLIHKEIKIKGFNNGI